MISALNFFQTFAALRDASVGLTEKEYKENVAAGFIFFEITDPPELAYTYKLNPSDFSLPYNTSFREIGLVASDPPCGCGSLTNAEDVEGKIVLIERGECSFVSKGVKAEEAGALGALITDDNPENDDYYLTMVDDTTSREVGIPVAFLLGKNGNYIKQTLEKLKISEAIINIPINISNVDLIKMNQPPWIIW